MYQKRFNCGAASGCMSLMDTLKREVLNVLVGSLFVLVMGVVLGTVVWIAIHFSQTLFLLVGIAVLLTVLRGFGAGVSGILLSWYDSR